VVDSIIWRQFEKQGKPIGLEAAARHFRCRGCGSGANVLLVPTHRPEEASPVTWERVCWSWFHTERSERKKGPRR
jgi:hypothetical protein